MTERGRDRLITVEDPARFAAVISAALTVFGLDVSYAVAMARAAAAIDRKRLVGQARREVRAAEIAAKQECDDTDVFPCHALSACGIGDCKFATGDYAALSVIAGPGTVPRVQRDSTGPYSRAATITAMAGFPRR